MNNFGKDQLNMTEFNPEDVSDPITGDASGFNPDAYNDGGLGGDISSLYLPNIPTTSSTFEYAPTQPPQDQPHSQQQQQQQQQPPPPPPQAPFQQDYQPQESQQYYMYEGGSSNNTYSQQDYNNMDCATYGTEMKVTTEEDDLRRCMLEIEYNSIKTFKEYNKISDDVTVEDEMGSKIIIYSL